MKATELGAFHVDGEIDERIHRSIRHLEELNTDEMRREMVRPDPRWHWGADYMGRWIGVMAQLGKYTGEEYGASAVAHELVSYQEPNGSLGPYSDPHDHKEWLGMGRGLTGLLEYYAVLPDPEVLHAAIRLGDYYEKFYPSIADCMYECHANGLEGLVLLAKASGDERHLQTAIRVAETSMLYKGVLYSKELGPDGKRAPCSGHVHCHLMTARGLLDLYEVTGEERFRAPALSFWDVLAREMLWVSGGLGEFFHYPEHNETCADADWLRLNVQLWRMTRDEKYMDLAERVLFNQLLFAQADNGAFCYRRGLQNIPGSGFDACCSHHGPRALLEATRYVYATEKDHICVNMYLEGEANLDVGDHTVRIISRASGDGQRFAAVLELRDPPPTTLQLSLRIPDWAGSATLLLNGRELREAGQQRRISIERSWADGDRLEVRLPLQVRVVEGMTLGKHTLCPGHVAVFYGPRLLVLNGRFNPEVNLHFVRLQIDGGPGFAVESADRIQAQGVTVEGDPVRLIYTPLANVGGHLGEMGRIHSAGTQYFRVWVPVERPLPVS